MDKFLCIVDPAKNHPEISCFNKIAQSTRLRCLYFLPNFGEPLSDLNIRDIAGLVVLGSGFNVDESPTWQQSLKSLIKDCVAKDLPVLGICYGHQLIAHTFGCQVYTFQRSEKKFVGPREVQFHSNSLFPHQKEKIMMSHRQAVTSLSPNFEICASSDLHAFEELKLKGKKTYTIQGHPEATSGFLKHNHHDPDWMHQCSSAFKYVEHFIELVQSTLE